MMSFPVSDVGSGHLAAFGILLSLYHRNRTGEGQSVSASLAHTASFIQAPFMLAYDGQGLGPAARVRRTRLERAAIASTRRATIGGSSPSSIRSTGSTGSTG